MHVICVSCILYFLLFLVEPPHIVDIKDILVDINVQDNVTLTCSFTGYPTPTVYWMRVTRKRRQPVPEYQYFNDNTIITGNTAILSLSNVEQHLGSYQCVVTNEAGYVSRTARVLPKGKCQYLYRTYSPKLSNCSYVCCMYINVFAAYSRFLSFTSVRYLNYLSWYLGRGTYKTYIE